MAVRISSCNTGSNLSDPAVEERFYDSQAMRRFVGIDLGREPVPDETTVCRFRHLLEARDSPMEGERPPSDQRVTPFFPTDRSTALWSL